MSVLDKFKKSLTEKQFNILEKYIKYKPKTTLLSGGKRSGKSYLLVLLFLIALHKLHKQNGEVIIAGGSLSAIRRNILSLLESYTGKAIKLGRLNEFTLFNTKIYCVSIGDIGALEVIRGFTAKLILINEVSVLNDECVKELQDRCSVENGQVLMDTNPTSQYSYVYKDIIEKGTIFNEEQTKMLQLVEHFCMLDNTFLSKEYIDSQLMRYHEGTTDYLRHVLGKYANNEGLIYYMYDKSKHNVDALLRTDAVACYLCGIDFGFEHFGSLTVVAKTTNNKFYVVDAVVEKEKNIKFWNDTYIELNNKYHFRETYADSARPDLIAELRASSNCSINLADKSVLLGIDYVQQLLSEERLFFLNDLDEKVFKELDSYSWDTKKQDKVMKINDDFLDSLRYVLYSHHSTVEKAQTMYSSYKGPIKSKQYNF